MDFQPKFFFIFFFSIFLYQNALKLISGMNFNYFYHINPFNQLKLPYLSFFERFLVIFAKKSQFRKKKLQNRKTCYLTENAF